MRAVTCTDGALAVETVTDPAPVKGQLVLKVLRCGICGSDLHARHHGEELFEVATATGYDGIFRKSDPVVFGHELCGEVVEGSTLHPAGTRVVSMPVLRSGSAVHLTGLSAKAPGGYAELVLAEDALSFAVPDGLASEHAALTEPLAVALDAVNRSGIGRRQVAVVVGCGPIGLAVISVLKAKGVKTVIASDLSLARRALAERAGADVVVDANDGDPFAGDHGWTPRADQLLSLAVDSMAKLRRIPLWDKAFRAADALGATTPKHPVVFECVGVPGIIDSVVASAPLSSTVVVVGVCMEPDTIRPALAINKEIDLRFVLGYTPLELRDSLHLLADGKVDGSVLVTGTVGLDGVEQAFSDLGKADHHAKILIDPSS